MRITVDATPVLLRSAGVKNYLHHWVAALRAAAPEEDIRVFPYLDNLGALDHQGSPLGAAATVARIALIQSLKLFGAPLLDAALGRTDVFHASNQVRCAPRRAKLTATVHDLTCWLMPAMHTPGNLRADQQFADRVLRRAEALIAVSENTRQDAIKILGIQPEKIVTIHSGVAAEYFDAPPTRRAKPYVLFVGAIEPRKNLDTLLNAWARLKPDLRNAFDLVTAGPRGWAPEPTFARLQAETTYLGYVPETQMPGLMAGATVFVYPSFYEGFGFPVAQALAARVPVVTSNSSSLPEIARDGALLVDPKSPEEIAVALTRLLESESDRIKLTGYGRASAERFRWEKCAVQSREFFRRVSGR